MDEEKELIKTSPEYEQLLEAIERNGAYVQVLESEPGKDKKISYWDVKKGSKNHGITDEMLLGFTPHTRRIQRAIFHKRIRSEEKVKAEKVKA